MRKNHNTEGGNEIDLTKLVTDTTNPNTMDLDQMTPLELVSVMNHLHIMACTVSTDIGDTWLTVFSNRSNLLQNRSN